MHFFYFGNICGHRYLHNLHNNYGHNIYMMMVTKRIALNRWKVRIALKEMRVMTLYLTKACQKGKIPQKWTCLLRAWKRYYQRASSISLLTCFHDVCVFPTWKTVIWKYECGILMQLPAPQLLLKIIFAYANQDAEYLVSAGKVE